MAIIIDTCVISDMVNTAEPKHRWSMTKYRHYKERGPVLVSDIVYCELSINFPDVSSVDQVVTNFAFQRFRTDDDALFMAGRAFIAYRRSTLATKHNVLPDFLIGATAAAEGLPVLTRDTRRFRTHFPSVSLICPETHP